MKRVPGLLVAANAVSYVFMVVMNGLATTLPLNGRTTAEISDSFANTFAPAGYVFSIWGIIYTALLAFLGYQFTVRGRTSVAVERVGWLFVVNAVANGIWIVFWHYGMFPATMAMTGVLLATLCAIAIRIGIPARAATRADRWFVHLPFAIYLGWVSVATIANAAVMFLDMGWNGEPLTPEAWTLALISVATGIGAVMVVRRGEVAFAAVLIWAFVGIAVKQVQAEWVPEGAQAAASLLAVISVGRLIAGLIPQAKGRATNGAVTREGDTAPVAVV
jgi:hypothetical protein